MIQFLSLPWDHGLEQFHISHRATGVSSAAVFQVQRPLYQSSIGRWENYPAVLEVDFDVTSEGSAR